MSEKKHRCRCAFNDEGAKLYPSCDYHKDLEKRAETAEAGLTELKEDINATVDRLIAESFKDLANKIESLERERDALKAKLDNSQQVAQQHIEEYEASLKLPREIVNAISTETLGYVTERDHEVLENYADRIIGKVKALITKVEDIRSKL